jgi:hypothetical protein
MSTGAKGVKGSSAPHSQVLARSEDGGRRPPRRGCRSRRGRGLAVVSGTMETYGIKVPITVRMRSPIMAAICDLGLALFGGAPQASRRRGTAERRSLARDVKSRAVGAHLRPFQLILHAPLRATADRSERVVSSRRCVGPSGRADSLSQFVLDFGMVAALWRVARQRRAATSALCPRRLRPSRSTLGDRPLVATVFVGRRLDLGMARRRRGLLRLSRPPCGQRIGRCCCRGACRLALRQIP